MVPKKSNNAQSDSAKIAKAKPRKPKAVKEKTAKTKVAKDKSTGKTTAKKPKSKKVTLKKSVNSKVYVSKSKIHGKGLFAARKLPADEVLGLLKGKRVKKDGTYVMWVSATEGLEITNDFRFINHSDKPNVALYDQEVVTLRAVKADEELTHNYDG